jgi:hypothetical protein
LISHYNKFLKSGFPGFNQNYNNQSPISPLSEFLKLRLPILLLDAFFAGRKIFRHYASTFCQCLADPPPDFEIGLIGRFSPVMFPLRSLAGGPNVVAYATSKAAVLNLSKSLAIDLGCCHIRVVCICPGDTETPSLVEEAAERGISYEDLVARSSARRPLGRIGTAEDIARGVLFLASDDGRYITGVPLIMDGGGLSAYGLG